MTESNAVLPSGASGADDAAAVDTAVDEIVRRGPAGAFAVAGAATFVVVALYVAFYVGVYLPRGIVQ